jgi:hypothetical protein
VVLEAGPLVIEVLGGVVSGGAPRAVAARETVSGTAAAQVRNVTRESAVR